MRFRQRFSIFVIFMFVLALIPFQQVQASPVDETNLLQLFNRLDRKNSWEQYKTRVDDSTVAWAQSYLLRSYLTMYETTGDKRYLDEFVAHADSALKRRDSVRGVKDYRGLSLPAWRSAKLNDNAMIYAVQTGVTVAPLAQFAAVVKKDPALTAYSNKANQYLKAAIDAVDVHDMRDKPKYLDANSRWIESGNKMYLDRPTNFSVAMGSAMLAIYEATGDKTYLTKATKIANFLKEDLTTVSSTNSYVWRYYPIDSRYTNTIEDFNHAVYDIEFIHLAYRNGLFSNNDMQKFANTASKVLVKSNGTIANFVDGRGTTDSPGWIAHWLYFEPWAPSLMNTSYKILSPKSSVSPKELYGVALMNYVYARNNNALPGPQPQPEPKPDPKPEPQPDPKPDPQPGPPAPGENLIVNGDFSQDTQGWVNRDNEAVIRSSSTGNKFIVNTNNFGFYQELSLAPGVYKLNARTKAGTSKNGGRIVIQFRDQKDNKTVPYDFSYRNTSAIWEVMPEMTIEVPANAVVTRLYLSANPGDNGTQFFDDITLVPVKSNPINNNLIINGDFSQDTQGWVNRDNEAAIRSSSTGNKFIVNTNNFGFYQELSLAPGVYKLNARTKAGISKNGGRIVIQFRDQKDNKTVPYDFSYRNTSAIWEVMPEMTIEVPANAVVTRLYLSANPGDNGTQFFDDIVLTRVK